jgi:2-dehydropantoate 2-reductase
MRVLVVGAGATGGLFGALLARAGRDVTFLVRAERSAQLRERGLQIKSPNGDFAIVPQLMQASDLHAHFDLILLGLKAHALERALDDFAPAVGANSMILPMLNGMRHIDLLVRRFGERPVLGGVCVVASMLDELGTIMQLNEMQELIYGERTGGTSPRVHELDSTLQGSGFTARSSNHIMRDMWEKWIFLASLAASNCLLRGSIGTIVAAGGASTISGIFEECVAIARAAGSPPSQPFLEATSARLTQAGSPLTASMYRDMQQAYAVEADAIVGDLVARARSFNVPAPLLAAAFAALTVYERGRAKA